MGIDVAEHHRFSIVTTQVALPKIGCNIACLWSANNGNNNARPIVVAIAPAMDTSRVKATSVPITAQIMPMMILLVSMAFTESVHK